MKKVLLSATLAAMCGSAIADSAVDGPMAFEPLTSSAILGAPSSGDMDKAPWEIPAGYSQKVISDESNLDIYSGISDWHDMNTVNETKKSAGRYMYRTHEVRARSDLFGGATPEETIANFKAAGGGAVSVVDLKTGESKILVQREDWEALDGIVWTPWHTLLFAEEANQQSIPDPDHPNAVSGLVYEIELGRKDPMNKKDTARVSARTMLGSLAHEGIEVDAEGNIYVIDEDYFGSIYKFVPETYGDLSEGQLYVLRLTEDQGDRTGPAEWVAVDMDKAQVDAQVAATEVNATTWCRPEDLERIGKALYVALTCNKDSSSGQRLENRVLSVSLGKKPVVRNFVKAGVNAPVEDGVNPAGFSKPDNLANGPDGALWIVEDNKPSDIWVALPDNDGDGYSDGVHLFASLADNGAEGTGIYFGNDPHTLFVNVQHSATGNDKTMVITHRDEEDDDHHEADYE